MTLSAFQYSTPFTQPFRSGVGQINRRTGLLLLLESEAGIALGEAAPLPGFSPESLDEVIEQYREKRDRLLNFYETDFTLAEAADFLRFHNLAPSLEFALHTLAVHHLCQLGGTQGEEWSVSDESENPLVNGIISLSNDLSDAIKKTENLVSDGVGTLKIKVGQDFEQEKSLLQQIRTKFPDLKLRIDANGSWTLDEALSKLAAMDELKLEYCEEPVRNPDIAKLKKLKKTVKTPVALDENLLTIKDVSSVLPHIGAVIIKPMIYGSLSKIFATKEMADDHNVISVFTTALETAVGRRMTALLARNIGSPVAHGLDTGKLLQDDFTRGGTYVRNGRYIIPSLEDLSENFYQNRSLTGLERIE